MKVFPAKNDLLCNPSLAAPARDYNPDADGEKADASAELRATAEPR
jgi:hypothetical protein